MPGHACPGLGSGQATMTPRLPIILEGALGPVSFIQARARLMPSPDPRAATSQKAHIAQHDAHAGFRRAPEAGNFPQIVIVPARPLGGALTWPALVPAAPRSSGKVKSAISEHSPSAKLDNRCQ